MFILDGKNLPLNKAFTTADGTQYPSNWLKLSTEEQRAAIGITEQVNPISLSWDQRYYWGYTSEGELIPKQLEDETIIEWKDIVVEVDSTAGIGSTSAAGIGSTSRTYTQTGLKTLHINQTKETANTLLAPTDWYVIRKLERDVDVPVGIASYRAAVISISAERETLIGLTTSVAELKGLYESFVVGVGTEQTIQPPLMPEWPSL